MRLRLHVQQNLTALFIKERLQACCFSQVFDGKDQVTLALKAQNGALKGPWTKRKLNLDTIWSVFADLLSIFKH